MIGLVELVLVQQALDVAHQIAWNGGRRAIVNGHPDHQRNQVKRHHGDHDRDDDDRRRRVENGGQKRLGRVAPGSTPFAIALGIHPIVAVSTVVPIPALPDVDRPGESRSWATTDSVMKELVPTDPRPGPCPR